MDTETTWFLTFKRADGISELPKTQRAKAQREHYQRCLTLLKPMLTGGLDLLSQQELMNTGCIGGPQEECLLLKAQLEKSGLGLLVPNNHRVGPYGS